jgi:hypothetical protein
MRSDGRRTVGIQQSLGGVGEFGQARMVRHWPPDRGGSGGRPSRRHVLPS